MNRNFLIFIITSSIIAAIFLSFPQIDLQISNYFYNEADGFYLNKHPFFETVHNSVRIVATSIAVSWIALLAVNYFGKKQILNIPNFKLIYLILALAIGPGLVVNTIFKDNWGRARPHQTNNFGGENPFTPPFIIADNCERNCSFVSGDPSVGFYLFALYFAFRKRIFAYSALGLGILFGGTRIVQGAHFFSDVIFSGVFTFTTCYLLWLAFSKYNSKESSLI